MDWSVATSIIFLLILATELGDACNKGHYGHGGGWGEPVIILPKPTLIPKLKHAFYEGKALVDVHKIIAPSLKPLPYKKGLGFIGKGWLPLNHIHHHAPFAHHGIGYPFGVGKAAFVGHKGKIGYGKGVGWAPAPGPIGPLLDHGHGHGFHGGHHGHGLVEGHHGHGFDEGHHGHHLPVGPKFPVHHHHHHAVSHDAVTVVDKGVPHIAPPVIPPVPHEFGHK